MQVILKSIVDDLGFIAPVVAFDIQRVINAVVEELKWEPQGTIEISSQPDRFAPASAGATSDKNFNATRFRRKRRERSEPKY